MLVDSYFYPGFFDAQDKIDASRGPLAFIIKNYILRCEGIPRLIGYKHVGTTASAYFATESGQFLGLVQCDTGYNARYRIYSADTDWGNIAGFNCSNYADSAKSAYVISAITKDRARGRSPLVNARHVAKHSFASMIQSVLYKHARRMRKEPEAPLTLSLEDTAQITSILLNGDSPLTMPANVRAKVERIHAFMNLRTDTQASWVSHVHEMFGREKWVVIPREFVDDSKVWTVGAIQLPPDVLTKYANNPDHVHSFGSLIQITQPFKTYRHMSDLPDELMAAMTMQKHMLKTTHSNFVKGTDDLVPYTGAPAEVVWPEMNSGVYDVASGVVAYILDK